MGLGENNVVGTCMDILLQRENEKRNTRSKRGKNTQDKKTITLKGKERKIVDTVLSL